MQFWGYCGGCDEWFPCIRRVDGVVADWDCPVCGLHPVTIEQHDVADAPVATAPPPRRPRPVASASRWSGPGRA